MTINTTSTNEFALRIKTLLSASNAAWREIANVLSNAEKQFGFEDKRFRELLKEVAFSKATASKLIQIARDKRIAVNGEAFDTCSAWTVLYEVTTLDDTQFSALLKVLEISDHERTVRGNKVLTVATVKKIKNVGKEKATDPYRPAFSIRIDVEALRTKEFNGNEYEVLMNHLRAIANEVPFVRVDAATLIEKEEDRYVAALNSEYNKLISKHFNDAISSYKAHSVEWKRYRNKRKNNLKSSAPNIGPYSNWSEAKTSFDADPAEFYAQIGCDAPSADQLMKQVNLNLAKRYSEMMARVRSRPQFPTANAEIFDSGFGTETVLENLRNSAKTFANRRRNLTRPMIAELKDAA